MNKFKNEKAKMNHHAHNYFDNDFIDNKIIHKNIITKKSKDVDCDGSVMLLPFTSCMAI